MPDGPEDRSRTPLSGREGTSSKAQSGFAPLVSRCALLKSRLDTLELCALSSRKGEGNPSVRVPCSFDLGVNTGCNSRCRYCSFWRQDHQDLAFELIRKFFRGIVALGGRGPTVNVVGGEPTMRDDLPLILAEGTGLGLNMVVTSNGYRLAENAYARQVVGAGISQVVLSLDGFEQTNDELRREGGYRLVRAALATIRDLAPGVNLGLLSVVSGRNISELPDFIEEMLEGGVVDNITLQALTNDLGSTPDTPWYLSNPLWPSNLDEVEEKLEAIARMSEISGGKLRTSPGQIRFWKHYFREPARVLQVRPCSIGDTFLGCNPQGNIVLCPFLPPVGSLVSDNVLDCFYSAAADQRRAEIAVCRSACNFTVNCRYELLSGAASFRGEKREHQSV